MHGQMSWRRLLVLQVKFEGERIWENVRSTVYQLNIVRDARSMATVACDLRERQCRISERDRGTSYSDVERK
jgi:hypothetical protein